MPFSYILKSAHFSQLCHIPVLSIRHSQVSRVVITPQSQIAVSVEKAGWHLLDKGLGHLLIYATSLPHRPFWMTKSLDRIPCGPFSMSAAR